MTTVTAITTRTTTPATTAATAFTVPSFPMFLSTLLFARLFLVFTFPWRRRRAPRTATRTRASGAPSTMTVFIPFFSFAGTTSFLVFASFLDLTRTATSATTSAKILVLVLFNFFYRDCAHSSFFV